MEEKDKIPLVNCKRFCYKTLILFWVKEYKSSSPDKRKQVSHKLGTQCALYFLSFNMCHLNVKRKDGQWGYFRKKLRFFPIIDILQGAQWVWFDVSLAPLLLGKIPIHI